jgi:hypothetical protein
MKRYEIVLSQGRFRVHGAVQFLGNDLLLSIWGGTRPHIGAVGIAAPRPSLKDSGKESATSSNFTFPGHREDLLVKKISEKLASRCQAHAVVTAGLHWDNLTSREIRLVENLALKLADRILKKLRTPSRP